MEIISDRIRVTIRPEKQMNMVSIVEKDNSGLIHTVHLTKDEAVKLGGILLNHFDDVYDI